jgi:hypothetical protein
MARSEKYEFGFDGAHQNKRPWRLFYDCSKGVSIDTRKKSILKKAVHTCTVWFLPHFIWNSS